MSKQMSIQTWRVHCHTTVKRFESLNFYLLFYGTWDGVGLIERRRQEPKQKCIKLLEDGF